MMDGWMDGFERPKWPQVSHVWVGDRTHLTLDVRDSGTKGVAHVGELFL